MANIKVAKVIDGDTFQDPYGQNYRLANVNAPEKGKPGSLRAQAALVKMID